MRIDLIERLINVVERSQLAELEYTESGERVRIIRKRLVEQVAPAALRLPPQDDVGLACAVEGSATTPSHVTATKATAIAVRAGMAGVFYRSSAPDKPAFVSVGDAVEEGQTLGILEAMKMLNPIEAEQGGRIVQILQDDGALVEAGADLFIIESVVLA